MNYFTAVLDVVKPMIQLLQILKNAEQVKKVKASPVTFKLNVAVKKLEKREAFVYKYLSTFTAGNAVRTLSFIVICKL